MTLDVDPNLNHYDPHLIPAESAARALREGSSFCKMDRDDPNDREHLHTRDGYTIDREGLIDNFAVEPEMYVSKPGDLREKERQLREDRLRELVSLSEDETGKLTMEHDWRHRGPGLV